jgi:ABC-2 type transport system ATP-binding protein
VTEASPSIRLDDVSRWYGDVLAVNGVTGEFGPGVSALLGPNGAGKSTLLKVVTGMLRPSLGTVSVCGRDPVRDPAVMRRVGLVPEQDPVYPHASALDVVTYLTRLHGFSAHEARTRARATLERVGLAGAMERSVAGYSKGMRQRAKLAQALAHDPDLLILDEPLNGLDPVGRREIVGLVRSFAEEGRCVVVSSHVLHEVETMARRVFLLDHGRVIAQGTVAEIRRELSDRPLAVVLRTPDARAAARAIVALDGVRRLDVVPGGLHVWTTRPDDLFDAVPALVSAGVRVDGFQPVDEDLEAVFQYLTSGAAPS